MTRHKTHFSKVTGTCLLAIGIFGCVHKVIAPAMMVTDIAPDVHYVPAKPDLIANGSSLKLKDGLELSFSVGDTTSETSWAASGKLLPRYLGPSADIVSNSFTAHPALLRNRAFTILVPKHLGHDVSGTFRVPDHPEMSGRACWSLASNKNSPFTTISFFAIFPLPKNIQLHDVLFGFSDKPWKTVGTYYTDGGKQTGVDFKPKIMNTGADGMMVQPTIPDGVYNSDFRIVVFDIKGAAFRSIPDSGLYLYINRSHEKTVQRVELQTRPYTWIEYKNVRMYPDSGLRS